KTKAKHANLFFAGGEHHVHGSLDLQSIAGQERSEHRHLDIELLRFVVDGAQILWQARTAKSKARFQVIGRQIEFGVLAKDIHHLVAIDSERFADVADFIGKTNLERVKTIAHILDHLSCLHLRNKD